MYSIFSFILFLSRAAVSQIDEQIDAETDWEAVRCDPFKSIIHS
jgi:hypothetical protein